MSEKRKVKVLMVTPTMAEKWLNSNTHNRPLRDVLVERYAREMKAGQWKLTPEPIAFSKPYTDANGALVRETLINGQHRLYAVIEAGVPAEMTVWWGCEPDEFEVIDQGATRTLGDILSTTRTDLTDHTLIAGVCSSFAHYGIGITGKHIKLNAHHVNEILGAFRDEILTVVDYKKKLKKFAPRPVVSALVLSQICNPTMTALIVNQLKDAIGFTERDPIRALHLYIADQLTPTSRDSHDVQHYKSCHAICARLRGDQLRVLRITGEGVGYLRDGARTRLGPVVTTILGRVPQHFYSPRLLMEEAS